MITIRRAPALRVASAGHENHEKVAVRLWNVAAYHRLDVDEVKQEGDV
jgi:hypothetical protein